MKMYILVNKISARTGLEHITAG